MQEVFLESVPAIAQGKEKSRARQRRSQASVRSQRNASPELLGSFEDGMTFQRAIERAGPLESHLDLSLDGDNPGKEV